MADKQIKAVATVNSNGRIRSMGYFGGGQPNEGLQPDGSTVVYLYDDVDTREYVTLYYYDFNAEIFIEGPPPPHGMVIWNQANSDWDPDKARYDDNFDTIKQKLLYLTDWVNVPDNGLDKTDSDPSTNYNQALAYRQEVRDFKLKEEDYVKPPPDLDWPIPPSFLQKTKAVQSFLNEFSYRRKNREKPRI